VRSTPWWLEERNLDRKDHPQTCSKIRRRKGF